MAPRGEISNRELHTRLSPLSSPWASQGSTIRHVAGDNFWLEWEWDPEEALDERTPVNGSQRAVSRGFSSLIIFDPKRYPGTIQILFFPHRSRGLVVVDVCRLKDQEENNTGFGLIALRSSSLD
ncbi:hypothetical protein PanWU01x14_001930 [Parasponia andersonii]|uniref:Uncharacterized protein n=1 Tax=Parasponia andersonii TaxID=3476 RepID=A0A2P5E507_PARAD|nr:hypothetical protein PanWU01x14_001930 [Parasponia andersonii]